MSERKRPGRPGESRSELVQRTKNDATLMNWAEALLEERRRNGGAPLSFPEPPPPSSKFDAAHKRYFLELLAATDSPTHAVRAAGFSPTVLQTARDNDPEFDRAFRLVQALVRAYRRARTLQALEQWGHEGINRVPKFDRNGDPLIDPETKKYVYTSDRNIKALELLARLDIPEMDKTTSPLVEINAQTGVIRVPERAATEEEFDEQAKDIRAPQFEDAEFEVKPPPKKEEDPK